MKFLANYREGGVNSAMFHRVLIELFFAWSLVGNNVEYLITKGLHLKVSRIQKVKRSTSFDDSKSDKVTFNCDFFILQSSACFFFFS